MNRKKKGYPYLLAVTVLLTLGTLVTIVPAFLAAQKGQSWIGLTVLSFALFIAAGATCVTRKRYFTEEE